MLRRARTSSYHRHARVDVYKDPLVAPWEATVLRPLVSRRVFPFTFCIRIDIHLSPAFSYVGSPELDVVLAYRAPAGTLPSRPPSLTSRAVVAVDRSYSHVVVTLGRKTVYGTGAFVPHFSLIHPYPRACSDAVFALPVTHPTLPLLLTHPGVFCARVAARELVPSACPFTPASCVALRCLVVIDFVSIVPDKGTRFRTPG